MHTPPPGHRVVMTEDGTPTLHSERFDESCHSTSGAREETFVHYIQGCHIPELLTQHQPLRILEVGFGTGLGWRETYDYAQKVPGAILEFTSLEMDEELVKWALPEAQRFEDGARIWYQQDFENAQLRVIIGDARIALPKWKQHIPAIHAIYQDAFSPRKNPTLWTVEWFELLGSMSSSGTRLSTYSASISIRKALALAGWGVYPGEAFARKKASTRASWQRPSDENLMSELEKHTTPALRDGL